MTIYKHIRTYHDIVDSTDKEVKCSCGSNWIITKIEYSVGDDKFEAHLKEKTGKYSFEHD